MARSAIELLKRSDMFGQLTEEQLTRVADLAAPQTYAEGAVIIEEDQPASRCFFVISGRVDIEIRPPYAGRGPQRIAQIKAGEVFGELSLVDGFLRSATARAVEPVEVLVFENKKLEALLEEDPRIGYRVMRNVANILSARIRTTNMKLRNAISDVLYY
jgi:CRP/FNR family transcriptional regulator, cyclic AMP receptor protein